jgi:hypothetical protein
VFLSLIFNFLCKLRAYGITQPNIALYKVLNFVRVLPLSVNIDGVVFFFGELKEAFVGKR